MHAPTRAPSASAPGVGVLADLVARRPPTAAAFGQVDVATTHRRAFWTRPRNP